MKFCAESEKTSRPQGAKRKGKKLIKNPIPENCPRMQALLTVPLDDSVDCLSESSPGGRVAKWYARENYRDKICRDLGLYCCMS